MGFGAGSSIDRTGQGVLGSWRRGGLQGFRAAYRFRRLSGEPRRQEPPHSGDAWSAPNDIVTLDDGGHSQVYTAAFQAILNAHDLALRTN